MVVTKRRFSEEENLLFWCIISLCLSLFFAPGRRGGKVRGTFEGFHEPFEFFTTLWEVTVMAQYTMGHRRHGGKRTCFRMIILGILVWGSLSLPGGEGNAAPQRIPLATGDVLILGELSGNPLQPSSNLFRRSGLPSMGNPQGASSGGLPGFSAASPPASSGLPAFGGGGTALVQPGGAPVSTNPLVPPAQPGGGAQTLPLMGWKQYNLTQAFGYDRTITGSLEYPSSWQANLDVYNRMVEFSDPRGTGFSCTVLPGIIGQFMAAQDLAGQLLSVLQQSMPNLQILQQQFNEDPTAAQSGMMVTKGRVILSGYLGNLPVQGMLMTYAMAVPGSLFGAGAAVLCLAPHQQFPQAVQEYFNRIIASYEKSLGMARFGAGTEQGLSQALQSVLGQQ